MVTVADLDPRAERRRLAAEALKGGRDDLKAAGLSLLMALYEPPGIETLPAEFQRGFYPPYLRDKARAEALAEKAARAALAVLLSDPAIDLPVRIGVAFDLPAEGETVAAVRAAEALVAA